MTTTLARGGAAVQTLNVAGNFQHQGANLAFFGASLSARAAAYTQTHSTADRTLAAYASDAESGTYTGVNNLQVGTVYALVSDLNQLRVAYETLRVLTEDLAAFVNAVVDDMQTYGLLQ